MGHIALFRQTRPGKPLKTALADSVQVRVSGRFPVERAQNRIGGYGLPAQELIGALKAHPFTRGLAIDYIRLLAGCGRMRDFAAGDYLWRQGNRTVEAFLVLDGEIALEIAVPHEGKLLFESIRSGEVVGCTAMSHDERWGFDGRAVTPVRTIAMNSRNLRAALKQDHEFGFQIHARCTRALGKRLNASRLRLVETHGAALL
jgi:CRP-like cAMP-binding protein